MTILVSAAILEERPRKLILQFSLNVHVDQMDESRDENFRAMNPWCLVSVGSYNWLSLEILAGCFFSGLSTCRSHDCHVTPKISVSISL